MNDASATTSKRYDWSKMGDVNAFFGLMLDNVAVMVLLVAAITSSTPPDRQQPGSATFTPEFVLTRMIPGTALGVLLGDLIYTWMAFRLARKLGKHDVTAMPLGLDTPSAIGVALLILLPTLRQARENGMDHASAMTFSWHVGVLILLFVGVFKVVFAPFGNAVRRLVPRAGLLGSLAAIALAMIAFLPLLMDIAAVPAIGMICLTIILITLIAHQPLPGRIPGAFAAVAVGTALYWLCDWLAPGLVVPHPDPSDPRPPWSPPQLLAAWTTGDQEWWRDVVAAALEKLPIAVPFALATIVGGIDCTESAAAAGDEFDTRTILLTEGVASVAAGIFGGVLQTTPYIGQPAYKAMGARASYTLATALFIGAAGFFGWFTDMFDWLPKAAMFPILVFVGLEITSQTFHATPTRHYPALALAMLPALAMLALIPVDMVLGGRAPDRGGAEVLQTLRCLAHGFIITSLLWSASLAAVLDGSWFRGALYLMVASVCALYGIIHSPLPYEMIGLPQDVMGHPHLPREATFQTPYHWAGVYAVCALILIGMGAKNRSTV